MSNGIRLTGSVPPSPNVNSFDAGTATVLRDEKTLMDVALRLGIPEELLRQANPDIDPKNVSPGQDIQIPSKSATTEAAKAPEAFGSDQTSQGQAGAKVAEQKLAGLARQAQLLAQVSPGPTGIGGPVGTTPKNPVDQLTAAVMDGNEKEVERLIKSGIDVNGKDSSLGWTPLTFAVTAGNDKIAELLLKNGARIDEPMQDGHTALTTLAKRDTPGSGIDFLISHGANLNHQDNAGKTALKYSTEKGNKEFVDKLLQSGANPDVKDADQRTALMEAAKSNNKEIVNLLLSKKAKTDIEDKDHNTALRGCVRR
jgi:hypothetical protein